MSRIPIPIKLPLISACVALCVPSLSSAPVTWFDGTNPVSISVDKRVDPVVKVAIDLFDSDIKAITGVSPKVSSKSDSNIEIIQLDKASKSQLKLLRNAGVDVDALRDGIDAFAIKVYGKRIIVAGANGRGTAYGLLELSRMAGVSPWVWWGDVLPEKKGILSIDSDYSVLQGASVEKRGIFINDEDWSLRRWSQYTHDPSEIGRIGPETYRKVFELLLRLRANSVWPAMHEGTEAFFKNPRNKVLADSFGIFVGTSHCEPLLRNNVDEWEKNKRGAFNYNTNSEQVKDYWSERLKEVSNSSSNMFTIGMRGIHDGSMEGYSSIEDKFNGLQQVIDDQQQLIAQYIGNPADQMQVFVPYKEVLDLYQMGLKLPDNVTLMWCDDNYGYITRLSDADEQKRPGGGGLYYHLSYWGRPHDHLWLATTQPGLIYHQLRQAYDNNVRKLWIINVHDPKVAAYDLQLAMDMAWDINSVTADNIPKHLHEWLTTQFGENVADAITPALVEYYRLCGIRRPEFMGWDQVELDKKKYDRGLSQVRNTEFSSSEFGNELDRYLSDFYHICNSVDSVSGNLVDERLSDAFFAAVEYPVKSAAMNAVKMLEAQRARQLANGSTRGDVNAREEAIANACAKSQNAYYEILRLTDRYNEMGDGRWRHSMDANPRHLPSLAAPVLPYMLPDKDIEERLNPSNPLTASFPVKSDGVVARNADSYSFASDGAQPISMLGHSMNAVAMPADGVVRYEFEVVQSGDASLTVALIPTHSACSDDLRFSVSIDGASSEVFSLKEPYRSEQWKLNVLRGQARRSLRVSLSEGKHTLEIKALDPNIVIDQWMIDFNPRRSQFYMIPAQPMR